MNNVISIVSVDKTFKEAKEKLDENEPVIVVGIDKDGFLRVASTHGSIADTIYLLEKAKTELLR